MLPARNPNTRGDPLKKVVSVARRTPAASEAQRLPLRVLQSGHPPAQLSLFLRPAQAR